MKINPSLQLSENMQRMIRCCYASLLEEEAAQPFLKALKGDDKELVLDTFLAYCEKVR